MKINLLLFVLLNLSFCHITSAQGINFDKPATWKSLKTKALTEHKVIFVKVGATWCVPCHMMEKDVFSQKSVGDFYNANFINVSVQGDRSKMDDDYIKSWYNDAQSVLKDYQVEAFPTYLFISADGELVYRGVGVMTAGEFITTGKMALDPVQNIAVQKALFTEHKMKLQDERGFAIKLRTAGEYVTAATVAKDYKANFLDKAADETLKTTENLKFIILFQGLITPGDSYFKLFYNHEAEIDRLLKNPGQCYRLTNSLITNQIVIPALYDNKSKPLTITPEWDKIREQIRVAYGPERAEDITLNQKYLFYSRIKDWQAACSSGIELIEKANLKRSASLEFAMNQVAYSTIFQHSDDKTQLRTAISWLERLSKQKPDDYATLDTYSCLLYKTGKTEEAIATEKKAIAAVHLSKESDPDYYLKIFNANLEKMNAGKPTW